jgi:hypothetical protein
MSKVEAYRCDYCREIVEVNGCSGVSLQPDMFDKLKSFPIINRSDKADAHLCGRCYNLHVVSIAERETNRKKDENAYRMKLEELAYGLRSQVVSNFTNSKSEKYHKK